MYFMITEGIFPSKLIINGYGHKYDGGKRKIVNN